MSIELFRELGRESEEQQSDTPVSAGDFWSERTIEMRVSLGFGEF